jgi:hypothetical protein
MFASGSSDCLRILIEGFDAEVFSQQYFMKVELALCCAIQGRLHLQFPARSCLRLGNFVAFSSNAIQRFWHAYYLEDARLRLY